MTVLAPTIDTISRFDQTRHLGRKPVTLATIGEMLRRRWKLMAAIVALAAAAAILAALLITPRYDATTRIRITPVGQSPLDYDASKDGPLDQAAVNTEVAEIRSRDVSRRVVEREGLQHDPEFLPSGRQPSAGSSPIAGARAIETATSTLLSRLNVEQQDKSYVLAISVRSLSPAKAARLANAIAVAYIENTADVQMSTAARQSATGEQALRRLGQEVEAADAAVANYRAQTGIVTNGGAGTITDQQVAPLSGQLATVESQAAAARSKVAAAERQIAAGGTDAVSAVLSSSVIADLRRQRAEAERQRAELSSRYGPRFPALIQRNQEIDAIDQQIRLEQQRIVDGLRSEQAAADAQAASLRGQLGALRGTIAGNNRASVVAESLQRKADAARAAYNRLAVSVQQASQARRSNEPQARIIEQATVPSRPSYPNRLALAAAGLLIGLVGGFAAVLAVEGLQATVRKPEDVETMLGVKFIGSVPRLSRRQLSDADGRRMTPAETLIGRPVSAYSEAFRTIRNAVHPPEGGSRKVIAVSSTLPAEGKTSASLSLARVMALSGDRVLLIDCDVRRAGLARVVDVQADQGVVEVLSGTATPEAALVADAVAGLDLMPVLRPTFTPVDLFSGEAMQRMLMQLRDRYDHIILDTPPLLGVADARTLSLVADAVALMVKWDATPLAAVDAALAGLEQDGALVLGVVLTMVDTKSEAMGALYYSSRYSNYYQQ